MRNNVWIENLVRETCLTLVSFLLKSMTLKCSKSRALKRNHPTVILANTLKPMKSRLNQIPTFVQITEGFGSLLTWQTFHSFSYCTHFLCCFIPLYNFYGSNFVPISNCSSNMFDITTRRVEQKIHLFPPYILPYFIPSTKIWIISIGNKKQFQLCKKLSWS